ncbi:hypothetical protein RHS02_01314, partial [Rhizoctonia solani]
MPVAEYRELRGPPVELREPDPMVELRADPPAHICRASGRLGELRTPRDMYRFTWPCCCCGSGNVGAVERMGALGGGPWSSVLPIFLSSSALFMRRGPDAHDVLKKSQKSD